MDQPGCTIGVDMGTTTVKAVAFDMDGREIARAAEALTLWQDETGAAAQDAAEVYTATTGTLARVAADARARGYVITRVGLSAAMHSLLPVTADGAPLMRAMTWMDGRAEAEAHALWASATGQALYARTGTPIHAMAPLPKLLWLSATQPHIFASAARFVSLKEWVWQRWYGVWEVDASLASATGLY
nr:sugar kinase [Ktedonobacterales bacterium]